jgi:hypothetical protein
MGCNVPSAFQMQKSILYQMPLPIQMPVILSPHLPVLLGRNDYLHPHFFRLLDNGIRFVTTIRQQILPLWHKQRPMTPIRAAETEKHSSEASTLDSTTPWGGGALQKTR